MGGGGNGDHTSPPTNPPPQSSSSRAAKGPQETAKLIWEKRQERQAFPPQAPYMELSQKKGTGGGAGNAHPLLRALTPGKKAAHLVLALQECWGAQRGETLFPLCIPFVATILNSLLPIPYRQWQTMQWPSHMPSLPLSHGRGARPQGRTRLGHEAHAVVARSGAPVKLCPSTLGDRNSGGWEWRGEREHRGLKRWLNGLSPPGPGEADQC